MLDAMLDATQSGATMGGRQRSDIVRRLLKKQERASQRQQLEEALAHLLAWQSKQGERDSVESDLRDLLPSDSKQARQLFDQWMLSLDFMHQMGIAEQELIIQPGIIRDWNYYTGMVFELNTKNGNRLGGGGRYDGLTELLGDREDVPAVGFAYYVDDILDAINVQQAAHNAPYAYTLQTTQADAAAALQWAKVLRAADIRVGVAFDQVSHTMTNVMNVSGDTISYSGKTYTLDQVSQFVTDLQGEA